MKLFIVKRVTENSGLWRIAFEGTRGSTLFEKSRVVMRTCGIEKPTTPEPGDVYDYDGKKLVLNRSETSTLYQIRQDVDI